MKVKNFSGTQAQWEETLSVILLDGEKTEFTRDVEAVAEVQSESSITITIRKSIEGIKVCFISPGGNLIIPEANIASEKTRHSGSRIYGR